MAALENDKTTKDIWPWKSTLITTGLIVIFALIYSQAPLYTSNQNQYFLHGAADAGLGSLDYDWLANTVDPTPVFSLLVQLTFQLRLPFIFHIYYLLLQGLYIYSIWGLLMESLKPNWSRVQQWLVIVLLIGMHSFALRFAFSRVLGQEWRFVLEGGFAGQRLLGTVLQPSTFGVFLLFGILLFLRGKWIPAVFSVVLAATIHPTYLLSAAVLIAGFMLVSLLERRAISHSIAIGSLALVLVSPILWYTVTNFQPTSPRLTTLASQILVEERIPNHILLDEWLHLPVLFQTGFILLTILGYRKRPIGIIIAVIAGAVFVLTLFQIETGNQRLGLLFPWRPSALLVPLASVLLIGIIADSIYRKNVIPTEDHRNLVLAISLVLLMVLALAGIGSYLYDMRGKQLDSARPMFDFIRSNHSEGDRFFTPPKQQDFRLATGAPIMVDFKSIPYVDTEVIEWHNRLKRAQNFYRDEVNQSHCVQIDRAIALEAINHVVLGPDQHGLVCPQFSELIFSDTSYQVYKLGPQD